MEIYVIFMFLLSGSAVSGALRRVWKESEFIADIYHQFPHSCIFVINSEAQEQGEF
jgi:hypothetical protein